MADGTVFNLPLRGVKIHEATEGVDILTDSFDANNYLQGFFRPPYKVLAEDTNISIPAASEDFPGQLILEYRYINLSVIKGLALIVECPMYVPPGGPGTMAEVSLQFLNLRLYWGGTVFFNEDSNTSSQSMPKNILGDGSILITTLPMDFSNAHLIPIAEKCDIFFQLYNDSNNEVIANIYIVGFYEQPNTQISIFDTGGGSNI